MKRVWRRYRDENKRMIAEVVRLQLEMDAKQDSGTLFPNRPYKFSTVAFFSVLVFFLTIALLGLAKEFLNSTFPITRLHRS